MMPARGKSGKCSDDDDSGKSNKGGNDDNDDDMIMVSGLERLARRTAMKDDNQP